jgi:hypothetical protein
LFDLTGSLLNAKWSCRVGLVSVTAFWIPFCWICADWAYTKEMSLKRSKKMNRHRTFPIFLCLYIRQTPKPDGINDALIYKKKSAGICTSVTRPLFEALALP